MQHHDCQHRAELVRKLQTMPELLRTFVAHQPMTQVVDAVRALVLAYP